MISRIKAICLKNGGRKNEVYYTLQSGRLFPWIVSIQWRNDEFEEVACFEKYDDCLRKYQSLVLQHLENTIPVAELFKHLKKTDLDNVVGLAGEKIMDDEDDERRWEKIWSALIRYRHPIIKECIEKIQVLYDVKISEWDK